jgi:hypothetical protein
MGDGKPQWAIRKKEEQNDFMDLPVIPGTLAVRSAMALAVVDATSAANSSSLTAYIPETGSRRGNASKGC